MNKITVVSLAAMSLVSMACSNGMQSVTPAISNNGASGTGGTPSTTTMPMSTTTTSTTMPVVTTTIPGVTTTTLLATTTTTIRATTTTTLPAVTTTTIKATTTTSTTTTTMAPTTTTTMPATTGSMTTTIQVSDFATGDGSANLVSQGIPFKSNVISDMNNLRILDGATEVQTATKVLAKWPNGSIRVILVQFSSAAGATKNYTVSVGTARSTANAALTTVSWKYPKRIFVMDAQYLSDSLIFWEQVPLGKTGHADWDSKQLNKFSIINFEPKSTVTCANDDQYYDTISTSYQMYVRTGQIDKLTNGRRWAVHHRKDQINLSGSNVGYGICSDLTKTRYTFVDGLVRDYFFWGDEESLRVAGLVVDNFYMKHAESNYYIAPMTRGFWTEREAAFAQLGLVAYYEGTGNATYLSKAKDRFYKLYSMQTGNGNTAWVHNLYDHDPDEGCAVTDWGVSPFMTGLLSEGLIRFHKLTGDATAANSINYAADYVSKKVVATGDGAGRGFIYLGCTSVYKDANPDIDNLLSPLLAYSYRLSGYTNTAMYNLGLAVFNYSTSEGATSDMKHYNQQFRTSGNFLGYIDPNVKSYVP